MTGNIWDEVLTRIETKVNRHSYYTWFKPTALVSDGGQTVQVRVPNALFRNWLTKHYTAVLDEALAEVSRAGCQVEFVVAEAAGPDNSATSAAFPSEPLSAVEPVRAEEAIDPAGVEPSPPGSLAQRYSFDTFVVGPSNQFAHAASRAVAEAPSRSYNPLFIYGGVGLGKTHLMHAIGHYVVNHLRNYKLTYISSERFMNEMINALHLNRMDAIRPDPAKFPQTAGRLDPRADFLREIGLFVDSIFREDRSVLDLLQANHTFVNQTLAWRYGIDGVRGDHFRRVELENPKRWGLLGKGALLLASSYPNRTSPVLRGEYVMRNIIGVPPEPPPPEVETDLDNIAPEENLTVRERLAIHRENPTCNGCHGVMDPLGFALENFDVDGTWRDVDRESGKPIDASGTLPDGSEIGGPEELRAALLAEPEQFVQTFVEKLLAYSLGRSTEWYDMPAVRQVVRESAADDYAFSAIVMGIVQSVPFTTRDAGVGERDDLSARSEETQQ
jgi:hypothetical protein